MFNPQGIWDPTYIFSLLPGIVVMVPLAGAFLVLVSGKYGDRPRNTLVLLTTGVTALLVGAFYPLLIRGPVRYTMELFAEFDFMLKVDYLSFLLALLFSCIWFLLAIFSIFYFAGTHAKTRFYGFFLATLGFVLGVVVAGDLFTFFLFFELMTFSSFVLFIHNQTRQSIQASLIYIFMGVIGGLSLLMGIFLIYHSTGTLEMVPLLEDLLAAGANVPLIILLFLLGFGIKMGMVPLHIWMPKAYEAAPSPVNAISSVALIKAGAYGLMRVMLLLTAPASTSRAAETVVNGLGFVVIWLGIITMLTGAVMALLQEDSHRILACSSISQMGYVLMGIGTAAYLGINGAMGYAGALFHIVNHAFIKGGLFLIIGTIYMHTRQINTGFIGGLGKKMPYLMTVFVLAALSIGGVPGFNGYVSKTLLHHAVVKAYQLHYDPSLWVAEKLFMLAGALTLCYFLRFFLALFSGDTPTGYTPASKTPLPVKVVLGVFSLAFVVIGLSPGIIYNGLILPSLSSFAFDPANIAYYLEGINFFLGADLGAAVVVVALAAIIYGAGTRLKWFFFTPPWWMSVETLIYVPAVRLSALIACRWGTNFDGRLNSLFDSMGRTTIDACKMVGVLDRSLDYPEDKIGHVQAAAGDSCEVGGEEDGRKTWKKAADGTNQPDSHGGPGKKGLKYLGRFQWSPDEISTKNINFDSLLLAAMLAIFLMVLLFLTTAQ